MKKGTTKECFTHLMQELGYDNYEGRRILAEIVGVETTAIRRWISERSVPAGMSLISLRYYLDFLGYEVSEISHLDKPLRQASQLLAFKVLTLADLANMVGYEKYPDQLLATLRGVRGVTPERLKSFQEVVVAYEDDLREKMAQTQKVIILTHAKNTPAPALGISPEITGSGQTFIEQACESKERDIKMFVFLVGALDVLTDHFVGSGVDDELRERVRQAAGQQKVFAVKNKLARLCGVKAFNNLQ